MGAKSEGEASGPGGSSPVYRALHNPSMFLARADMPGHPMPWIMWGGPHLAPGTHMGNVKFRPPGVSVVCPEGLDVRISAAVRVAVLLLFSIILAVVMAVVVLTVVVVVIQHCCCSCSQPPTVVCKMEAQSEYVHIALHFLHVQHQLECSIGTY